MNSTFASWQYFNPVKVEFTSESMAKLADSVPFQRALLVTTPGFTKRGLTARARTGLQGRLVAVLDSVQPNPDMRDIDRQATVVRELRPDCVIALGGGSSMDTAKALARLLSQPPATTLAGHFRNGKAFEKRDALPIIALPTTAGTGSEVTPFATVWDFESKRKHSLTGKDLYPAIAILDPGLTLGLPWKITLSSGLDAVSHALESAWNRHANAVTLACAAQSLRLSLKALPALNAAPRDPGMRSAMMQASLLAGLAISQTRTALAHAMSYPLTTSYGLVHGIACSFTLPALLRFNAQVDDGRLAELSRAVGYDSGQTLADSLDELFRELQVASLFSRRVPSLASVRALTDDMFTPGRADNNMRQASSEDVSAIVETSLRNVFNRQ